MGSNDAEYELKPGGPQSQQSDRFDAKKFARGPFPWVGAGAALVLTGSLIAQPAPSPWALGMVESIGDPVQRWQVEHGIGLSGESASQIHLAGESVIITSPGTIRAFGVANGDPLWEVPVDEAAQARCTFIDTNIACVIDGEAQVIVIDADDGEVARHEVPDVVGAAVIDGDMIVAVNSADDGPLLERRDSGGTVLWSQALVDQGAGDQVGQANRMDATRHHVMVTFSGTASASGLHLFEANDGAHVDTPEATMFYPVDENLGILLSPAEDSSLLLTTDGQVSDPVQGTLLSVDDDPLSDIVLHSDDLGTVTATRADREVWQATEVRAVVGRVNGVVMVSGAEGFTGLDVNSGRELWTTAPEAGQFRPLFADGRYAWVPGYEGYFSLDTRNGQVRDLGLAPMPSDPQAPDIHTNRRGDGYLVEMNGTHLRLIDLDP